MAEGATSPQPVQFAYFQKGNIFNSGLRGERIVALTFDDGPNRNTSAVLEALSVYGVKATFFIVGKMAARHEDILEDIAADGHLLANHSATHSRLGAKYVRRPGLLLKQIQSAHDAIAPFLREGDPLFFRAPYGYWKPSHAARLNADPVLRHYTGPIYWDVGGETYVDGDGYVRRSADWDCWHRGWTAATCAKGYLREIRAKEGGVVLLHCIDAKSAALVHEIVPALLDQGFRFVRLDEVREYDRYKTPPTPSLRPEVSNNSGATMKVAAKEP